MGKWSVGGWAVSLAFVAGTALAYEAQTPWQSLAARQYVDYLKHLDTEIGGQTPDWLPNGVLRLSAVAISLERTSGWDQRAGEQAARHVRDAPDAKRYFDAFRKLLGGDVTAVESFFEGGLPPGPSLWVQVGDMLAYHGCNTAAAAVRAYNAIASGPMPFMPDQSKLRLSAEALVALSAEDRARLLTVLGPRLERIPMRSAQLAGTCYQQALAAPDTQAACWVDLALEVQPSATASALTIAVQLAHAGKRASAIGLAFKAVQAQPGDPNDLQEFLIEVKPTGNETQFDALYRAALACWRPPLARLVRQRYVAFIANTWPDGTESRTRELGALAQCDLLVFRGMPEAADRYAALANDAGQRTGDRLDAWAGWLDATPQQALKALSALPLSGADPMEFRWVVDRLRDAVLYRESFAPVLPDTQQGPAPATVSLRRDAAAAAEHLLRVAPLALLTGPATGRLANVRPELAAMLALGDKVEAGINALLAGGESLDQLTRRTVELLRAARAEQGVRRQFEKLMAETAKRTGSAR